MRYTYVAGVVLLLYFAFMYLSERLWMKVPQKPTAVPPAPAPAGKTEATQGKGKKGKRK